MTYVLLGIIIVLVLLVLGTAAFSIAERQAERFASGQCDCAYCHALRNKPLP